MLVMINRCGVLSNKGLGWLPGREGQRGGWFLGWSHQLEMCFGWRQWKPLMSDGGGCSVAAADFRKVSLGQNGADEKHQRLGQDLAGTTGTMGGIQY